ncbi:MAG: hypothetical protein FWF12_00030 [Betaproteobacteria bacterium]|nr:hypothetical protein [Betaproteobacteria bacterium]
MEKPINAPGCFAAASVFSRDSDVCNICCAMSECAQASLETLQAIRGIINVSDLLARHEQAKKIARKAMQERDAEAAAALPPGNIQPPLMRAVERQTKVAVMKIEASADDERIIATLPVKLQKIAITLCSKGVLQGMKKGLIEGRNVLAESKPSWLSVALTHLVAGGFARRELREAMNKALGWETSSSAPHVSMAIAIFTAFGLAKEVEGRIVPEVWH